MPLSMFVICAYVLAFAGVMTIELTRSGRVARYAARFAILVALCGSSTWVYAAYFQPHTTKSDFLWPASHKPASVGEGGEHGGMDLGGSFDPEASGREASHDGRDSLAKGDAGQSRSAVASLVHKAAVVLGFADDKVIDVCPHCPAMVRVMAGSEPIGATDGDVDATPVEFPQQTVRVWPGFSISRDVIAETDFNAFLRATRRNKPMCNPALAVVGDGALSGDELAPIKAARCVSAADAEAYASWLTGSTGKRFRLPTAVEWEYAVRNTKPNDLNVGEVAEVVADCWSAHLPVPLSSQIETVPCERRMVKGAAAIDEARWHRPSARRPLDAGFPPLDVGFRLVQED